MKEGKTWEEATAHYHNKSDTWADQKTFAIRDLNDLVTLANSLPDDKLAEIFSPEIIEGLVTALLDNKVARAQIRAVNKPYDDMIVRLTKEINKFQEEINKEQEEMKKLQAMKNRSRSDERIISTLELSISELKMSIDHNIRRIKRPLSTDDTRRAQLAKIFGDLGVRYCADLFVKIEPGAQIHGTIYESLTVAARLCEEISMKVQIEKARNERKEVIRSDLLS